MLYLHGLRSSHPVGISFPDGRYGRQVQQRRESGEMVAKLLLTDIKGLQLHEVLCSGGYGWGKTLEESVTSRLAFQLVMGRLNQFSESVRSSSWFQSIGSATRTFFTIRYP